MKIAKRYSFLTLIFICSFLSIYRINNVNEKEISWDVLGYYLYLPATFIHDDPMFTDITWLKEVNEQKKLADTLYMVSSNDTGEPMYFFLMGTAILYLPFFFLGHISASLFGFPMDGFSLPYQYSMVIGGIIYTILGLILLRKILRHFFSEWISSIIMLIIVFGTNYIHHLTLKNLETVNILFTLACFVIWNTIKWHQNQNLRHLLSIGCGITLMSLIKPTEVLILLIPILWNVTSFQLLKDKLALLVTHKKSLIITIVICFLIALPQISYWYIKTGHIIYDTYKNPGVGLDVFSPHIIDTLFSFRKGWLIYTPVMLFSLIGLFFVYKKNRSIFLSIIIYFGFSFFIISSWTEWWYGAAFSIRPLITLYPLLAISLGYFLLYISEKSRSVKIAFGSIVLSFVFLNQFQWWQLKNYILDPYRTTKEYYLATFLKTSVTEKDRDLLLVSRDFSGINVFDNNENYKLLKKELIHFKKDENVLTENENDFYRLGIDQEFLPLFEKPYNTITKKDHVWFRATIKVRNIDGLNEQIPCLAITMEREEGTYGYFVPDIKVDTTSNQWMEYKIDFLTPEIRNPNDRLKCYIWKRGKRRFDVKDVKIEIFDRK